MFGCAAFIKHRAGNHRIAGDAAEHRNPVSHGNIREIYRGCPLPQPLRNLCFAGVDGVRGDSARFAAFAGDGDLAAADSRHLAKYRGAGGIFCRIGGAAKDKRARDKRAAYNINEFVFHILFNH